MGGTVGAGQSRGTSKSREPPCGPCTSRYMQRTPKPERGYAGRAGVADMCRSRDDEIRRRYETGESLRTIADATDRNYGTVKYRLRKAGVPLRSRGRRVFGYVPPPPRPQPPPATPEQHTPESHSLMPSSSAIIRFKQN